jgi:Glycosyltransferase 61
LAGLKDILKSIFPRMALKKAAGIYLIIKRETIDRIVFPELIHTPDQFNFFRLGFPFRENRTRIDGLTDPVVRSWMEKWNAWTQEEFILLFNQSCVIEPEYGWAITTDRRLIRYSLGIRTDVQPRPRLVGYLRRKKNVRSFERVISLRDSGEENYFHFYNDVLAKLFFLQQHSFDLSLHIVVAKKLWDKPYFQYYLTHVPEVGSLTWVVQDHDYIECQSALFCKPLTHRPDFWEKIFRPIVRKSENGRKLFLTRNKSRLRFIENSGEIEDVFRAFHFEIIDTDNLSPDDQARIFSQASFVAGIHGAGLTNIYFRTGNCHLLEIFPPPDEGYLPFHYIMLAGMKGFSYQAMIGQAGSNRFSGAFRVSPFELKKTMEELLR